MSWQGLLGIQDLGQVFFEPLKDKQGNILVVTLKEVKTSQTFESVRWVPLSKLQTSRKSVSSPEEPTALDALLMTMQVAGCGFLLGHSAHAQRHSLVMGRGHISAVEHTLCMQKVPGSASGRIKESLGGKGRWICLRWLPRCRLKPGH